MKGLSRFLPARWRARRVVKKYSGIRLDIGCGNNIQPGFIGMDVRPLPGVEIVHDVIDVPWPLPDESVVVAIASHLVEHIPPTIVGRDGKTRFPFIDFMNEAWRVLRPGGQLSIAAPHALSVGYAQDPTHINPINEFTFFYFTPAHHLYRIYEPKPWVLEYRVWSPSTNIEVVLRKESLENVLGKVAEEGAGRGCPD